MRRTGAPGDNHPMTRSQRPRSARRRIVTGVALACAVALALVSSLGHQGLQMVAQQRQRCLNPVRLHSGHSQPGLDLIHNLADTPLHTRQLRIFDHRRTPNSAP